MNDDNGSSFLGNYYGGRKTKQKGIDQLIQQLLSMQISIHKSSSTIPISWKLGHNKPICYSVQLEFGLNACT